MPPNRSFDMSREHEDGVKHVPTAENKGDDELESYFRHNVPEQRQYDMNDGSNIVLPVILSPPSLSTFTNANDVANWIQSHRDRFTSLVQDVGVVLFRGFPLETAEDFNEFVTAFDKSNHDASSSQQWTDLSYDRSMSFAVRKKLTDRICTTNEGKSGGLVFHHEQAQTPLWPSYIFFCCIQPAEPGDGGETGLTPSDQVYEMLKKKYPDFISKCETLGVKYTIFAGPNQDPSKGAGRGWKSFFHVSTKDECELKMNAGGWSYEWGVPPPGATLPNDGTANEFLKCTTPILDAVKVAPHDPTGSRKCFFNQLIATTANALEFSKVSSSSTTTTTNDTEGNNNNGYRPGIDIPTQEGIDACVRFGDDSTIPLEILLDAKQICEDLCINVAWQKGDVALISNYLMMHARRPWNGPEGTRKLVASLVGEPYCTSFGKELIAL